MQRITRRRVTCFPATCELQAARSATRTHLWLSHESRQRVETEHPVTPGISLLLSRIRQAPPAAPFASRLPCALRFARLKDSLIADHETGMISRGAVALSRRRETREREREERERMGGRVTQELKGENESRSRLSSHRKESSRPASRDGK